jgi:hypothetical protein
VLLDAGMLESLETAMAGMAMAVMETERGVMAPTAEEKDPMCYH